MDETMLREYMRITKGNCPDSYLGAEEQGKAIRRCSILKEVEIGYSNSSSYSASKEKTIQ